MIGVLLLWIGSLVLAFVADSVLDIRLSLSAVDRAEQRTRDELAARSLTESFARALQLDPDRAWDSLDDAWASFEVPADSEYGGLWPDDVEVTALDCERAPSPEMIELVSQQSGRTTREHAPPSPGRWLNVLTADVGAWKALGFSNRSSRHLVERARGGTVNPTDLVSIPGLLAREARVLQRLHTEGALKMRSEHFVLTCTMNGTTFESLLHREPARGEVRLMTMRRKGESRAR